MFIPWLPQKHFAVSLAILSDTTHQLGYPGDTVVENLSADAGDIRDMGLIPWSGRSPEIGSGNPLWYSCLGNPMVREA